jgi:WD40 repeat protein
VATATVSGVIVFWSWNADDIRWLIPEAPAKEQNYILGAAPSPDGTLVASASRSSGVDLWEASTGRRVHHVAVPGAAGASCVAFSADGQHLFSAHASGAICVTDLRTMRTQHVFPAHQASPESWEPNLEGSLIITGLAVQPSGSLIASASTDRTIKIWEPGGTLRHELNGHEDEATGVEFSPDGNLLASHSADSTIRLWDVATARVVRVLSAHRLRVHAVAWSPTGEHLASVSTDNAVLLWDLRRGGDPAILYQGHGAMTAIAYSADGTRIAASGMDKTIRLFDSQRRREVVRLQGHAGRIKSLRFGAADRVLVSGSIDGTVGVWDIAAGPTDGQWARPANVTRGIAQSAVMQR